MEGCGDALEREHSNGKEERSTGNRFIPSLTVQTPAIMMFGACRLGHGP